MPAALHVNPAAATLVVVTGDPNCVRTRLLNIVTRDPHVLPASIGVVTSIPHTQSGPREGGIVSTIGVGGATVITTWPSAAGWSARPPANIKDANPLHTSRLIPDFAMRLVKLSRIQFIKLSDDTEVSRNQRASEAPLQGYSP
jgi:hypothetical protein